MPSSWRLHGLLDQGEGPLNVARLDARPVNEWYVRALDRIDRFEVTRGRWHGHGIGTRRTSELDVGHGQASYNEGRRQVKDKDSAHGAHAEASMGHPR